MGLRRADAGAQFGRLTPAAVMRRLLGLAVLLSLAACDTVGETLLDPQTVDVRALSQDPAALVGAWTLVTVTGSGECMGECQQTRPASDVGWSERVTFRADGTAEVSRGGEAARSLPYRVERRNYGNGTQSETALLTLGSSETLFGVQGSQLFTDSRYVDGELLEYRRR